MMLPQLTGVSPSGANSRPLMRPVVVAKAEEG
jgi:hypothetical protein